MKKEKKKHTIIFLGHDASRTGAPNSLLKIVTWFKKNQSNNLLALLNNGGPLFEDYKSITDTYVWNRQIGIFRWTKFLNNLLRRIYQKGIIYRIKRTKPGIIFNNTGVNGDLVVLLKKHTGAKVISRIPELEAFMRRNALTGSVQKVLAASDHIIAVSKAVKENLIKRYSIPTEKITIIYGAIDILENYRPKGKLKELFKISNTEKVVIGCGTMDWRKGFDLFIQTAYNVCIQRNRREIKFVWIGGPVNINTGIEYDYEIEMLGLQSCFFRTGVVDNPSEYFADSNVFFLSSREDPFPLVMLEAASQGLPILCFKNAGGAVEFVDNEIGTIIPPLNIVDAGSAIIELVDNERLATKKGNTAMNKAGKSSVDFMCNEINEIVNAFL